MVNYKNSLIYRLCCKDPTITDEYIGSTTCKYRRKNAHKTICHNENAENYNLPVYQCIRANSGFENWDMIVLEEYPCESKVQLHMRERYWIEERRPTLNKNIPIRTEEEIKHYYEEIVEYQKQYYKEHKEEIREQRKTKYICECGSEIAIYMKSRHFKTQKHLKYLEELKELNDLKEDN